MAKINDLLEQIKGLTVVEVSELVKLLEEEFGVSAAAPVAVAAAPVAGAAAPAEAQEEAKANYDVVLNGVGSGSKVAIIKIVKEATGLGLTEAKELVEGSSKTVNNEIADEVKDTSQ